MRSRSPKWLSSTFEPRRRSAASRLSGATIRGLSLVAFAAAMLVGVSCSDPSAPKTTAPSRAAAAARGPLHDEGDDPYEYDDSDFGGSYCPTTAVWCGSPIGTSPVDNAILPFSQLQDDLVWAAIQDLLASSILVCQQMGQDLESRYYSGNIGYDPSDSGYGWMRVGWPNVHIGPNGFTPGELTNTLAHEASHFFGYLDLQNGSQNDAYRVGDMCATSI